MDISPKTVYWTINKAKNEVTFNPSSLELTSDNPTQAIEVTQFGDGTITATSSDTNIATVTVSGNTIAVTGVASGNCSINVSIADNGNYEKFSGSISVSVNIKTIPDIQWNTVTLPYSEYWSCIAFGNDKFVMLAGGNRSRFAYSQDGINWNYGTMPFSGYWFSIVYGNNKFVAIANQSSKMAYSLDGIKWSTSNLPFSNNLNNLSYCNGKFFITNGDDTKACYSDDGINWNVIEIYNYRYNISCIVYKNGMYLAFSDDMDSPYYSYSSDGIEWIAGGLNSPNPKGILDCMYVDDKLVASGHYGVYYSYTGARWVKAYSTLHTSAYEISYGNGMFVSVYLSNSLCSIDGITWKESPAPFTDYPNDISYGNNKFVAITDGNLVAYITTE